MSTWGQPLVVRNDWSVLSAPTITSYEPTLSVSVVVPAWEAGRTLPYVLAGLAAQSYPSDLLEVVVVDDGSVEALRLGEVRPEHTQIVRVEAGWGRANALNRGAAASSGQVLHWLDSDMLASADHVLAQLRWHHLIDYAVVLGTKRFVEPTGLFTRTPAQVRDLVAAGRDPEIFAGVDQHPHGWVDLHWARTDDLRTAGFGGFRSHVGATASLTRALFDDVGGFDPTLALGEDSEFGHRLAVAGAVAVPERGATSWHLGPSTIMQRRAEVNRYNDAALVNLMPGLRSRRNRVGRTYEVSWLEVVVPASSDAPETIGCVDAVLASGLSDLRVVLVGPWDQFDDHRRAVLDDPMLEYRIIERTYRGDPRVELRSDPPPLSRTVPYRLELSGTSHAPSSAAIGALVEDLERTQHAERRLVCAAGADVGRLRATSALARARRVGATTESATDAVLEQAYGRATFVAEEAGWMPTAQRRLTRYRGTRHAPWDAEASRAVFDRALLRPRGGDGAATVGTTAAARWSVLERTFKRWRR